MPIKYKIVKHAQPGIKGGGDYNYYLRSANRKKLNIHDVARILEKRSSISRADIIAVLTGISDLVPELLTENNSVELGELGIFSLDIQSKPSIKPEDANWRKIKKLKINFRIGKKLQQAIQNVRFERVK